MTSLERVVALRRRCDYGGARAAVDAALAGSRSDLGDLLCESGRLQEECGEYDAAAVTLGRVLTLAEATEAARTRAAAYLIQTLRSQARLDEASPLIPHAIPETAEGVLLLAASGGLAVESDDYRTAEETLDRALQQLDHAPQARLTDEARVAVLAEHGTLRRVQGRYQEAEALLRDALALAETRLGARSIEVANLLNDLGILFKFAGRFDEAFEAYNRGVAILTAAIGEDRPPLANDLHNLGGLEHSRGSFEAAELHARRGLRIRMSAFGSDHVLVAVDKAALAAILAPLGKEEEAERLLREALTVIERDLGADSRETATYTNNLAAILHRRGAFEQAEALYRRSLAAKTRLYGDDAVPLAGTLYNLAVTVKAQGHVAEAADLFRRAVDALDGKVSDDHPVLRSARRSLARLATEGASSS